MRQRIEAALIEWPSDGGGPRLLGTSTTPDVVDRLRQEIVSQRTRELARLGQHLQRVPDDPAAAK